MIDFRATQTTADAYRRFNQHQRSWMQRGSIFVLSPFTESLDELTDRQREFFYPAPDIADAFKEKVQEIYDWQFGKPMERQTAGWLSWYATENLNVAIEFKLRFC